MSVSLYIKSEKSEISLMKNIPLPYNYLMYGSNNGPRGNEPIPIRRINFESTSISFITEDQQYVKSTTYDGISGNLILNPYKNYIGFIQDYNRKNFSLGTEYPIYKYNVYQGVTDMIRMFNSSLQSLQDNLKPWYFMMFGQWIGNGGFEQYPVWRIYFTENIITFETTYASTIRRLDFDRYTGLPVGVPQLGLYRYDGYSNITKEILNSSNINPNDYFIYGGPVGRNGNWRLLVKNIITSSTTVTFITQDIYALKGIKFDKNTGQVLGNVFNSSYTTDANTVNSLTVTPFNKDGYCIFKTNGYNNTVKPNVSNILTTNDIKNLYNDNLLTLISNEQIYRKIDLLEDNFIVTAKVTDRIFIYDNNNKIIHITDYFAKGETQKINLRYSMLNGVINIQSNIIPLYPLPTPTTQEWYNFLR